MIALLALAGAITFHSDFEAGSLGRVEKVSETHFRCAVEGESDQNKRNRQANWYYFRIDGAAGRELTLDLVDLVGEYNFKPGSHAVTRGTRPVYSYDNRTWTHFDAAEWDDKAVSLRLRFTPKKDRIWIAHVAPYTTARLRNLLRGLRLKPAVVGKTVEGRDMLLLTAGDAGAKKAIWIMARQHSWETGTSWALEGALRFLLSNDPEAGRIRSQCVFKIFPMADPDGVARGGVRFNTNGYDLNRNWDAVDPAAMPEIAAQRKALLDGGRIDLFVTLHNTESADYIEGPAEFRPLAERFWKLLDTGSSFHSPRGPRAAPASTTPGMKGRMAVNQALYSERKAPAYLMELMVEANPKLGRCRTVEDWLALGPALVRAMSGAVE